MKPPSLLPSLLLPLLHHLPPTLATPRPCPFPPTSTPNNTYDYIITGSGPGGGTLATNLARAGHSVLLIEAGSDQSGNLATEILALGTLGNTEDVGWQFFVEHTDDEARRARYNLMVWRLGNGELWVGRDPREEEGVEGAEGAVRLGVYYPRGATLGGSAIVNAAATFLPSESDWEVFDRGAEGERVWSGDAMRRIFESIEHNNYLPRGTPGHGFDGWLQTNIANRSIYSANSTKLAMVRAGLEVLGRDPEKVVDYLVLDGNFLDERRDQIEGLFALPFHVYENWRRFSPRDYIKATRAIVNEDGTRKYHLDLQLNSLTTKVLFDNNNCSSSSSSSSAQQQEKEEEEEEEEEESSSTTTKPRAIGVQYLTGPHIYAADPKYSPDNPSTTHTAYARKEVILSGGTFNTPQILQLSGIGPASLLHQFNISVLSDLPGVGRNLQDNYELPIVGETKVPVSSPSDASAPNCTFGAPNDPCVDLWRAGTGPYAHAGDNAWSFLLKTPHSTDNERDMLLFSTGGAFRGFVPPLPPSSSSSSSSSSQNLSDPPTVWSWSTVKMHPQNAGAGVVQIQSADPRDVPYINFHHFARGADTDIGAILDAVAFGRRAFARTEAPAGPVAPLEPPCPEGALGEDGYCSGEGAVEAERQWVQDQVFGHHPTSSCAVGPEGDAMAVLDARLRVRGTEGLRVVDASAFPRSPGAFPAVATYMLAEKATELVLEDGEGGDFRF